MRARCLALHESGVELDTPLGKLFVRALEKDPEWNQRIYEAEEIRSIARDYQMPIRGEE